MNKCLTAHIDIEQSTLRPEQQLKKKLQERRDLQNFSTFS